MIRALLIVGWLSIIGSVGDGAILAYAALQGVADQSVEVVLRDHLPFLYWVKALAAAVMPVGVVAWLFALPAVVYFPARILLSLVIGWAALAGARRLARSGQAERVAGAVPGR